MSDTPVIYENPKQLAPEWAQWMAYEDGAVAPICFENKPFAISDDGEHWDAEGRYLGYMTEYSIPGPWKDSLRRLVRLSDPAYYCAENPHTDDEGFLPHDGEEMPEWVIGKEIEFRLRDETKGNSPSNTLSYRILPSDGVLPRSPSDASGEQYRRNPHLPSQEEAAAAEQMFQQEQRYHRNELAARTLTPVPGMDSFMHDVIREARRRRYREAALQGMLAGLASDPNVRFKIGYLVNEVHDISDAMIEKEDIDGRQ